MLDEDGVTVTVGLVKPDKEGVTVTEFVPAALL
jgi:hypothetical protein